MINKMFCKFGNFLCKKFCKNNYEYVPDLDNVQISNIKEKQAEFIYSNAINALKDIENCTQSLKNKADKVFQYTLSIATGLIVLAINKEKILIDNKKFFTFISTLVCLKIIFYVYFFIIPKSSKTIHNSPRLTLTKRALLDIEKFYIIESIEIEKFTMPTNFKKMQHTALGLNINLVLLSILMISFLIFIFFLF